MSTETAQAIEREELDPAKLPEPSNEEGRQEVEPLDRHARRRKEREDRKRAAAMTQAVTRADFLKMLPILTSRTELLASELQGTQERLVRVEAALEESTRVLAFIVQEGLSFDWQKERAEFREPLFEAWLQRKLAEEKEAREQAEAEAVAQALVIEPLPTDKDALADHDGVVDAAAQAVTIPTDSNASMVAQVET